VGGRFRAANSELSKKRRRGREAGTRTGILDLGELAQNRVVVMMMECGH
jgi:hypothetical protein